MASTQTLTKLPEIEYTGIDYTTIINKIKEIIAANPNWSSSWTSFTESEAGVMLIELFAFIADSLGVRQDLIFNELFISTVEKDADKMRLLKIIGYTPEFATNAIVAATIELDSKLTSDSYLMEEYTTSSNLESRVNDILCISGYNINGASATYELLKIVDDKPDYLGSIMLSSGSTTYTEDSAGDTLTLLEGKTYAESFSSDEQDGPSFTLSNTGIAQDSIRVFLKSTGTECLLVDSFLETDARDTTGDYADTIPYVIEMTESQKVKIRFATESIMTWSDTTHDEKLFPVDDSIVVFYRTTTGSYGNISANFINTSFSVNGISGKIYNESSGYNGSDEESLDDAVENGPLSLRHMNRAVTYEDYDRILKTNQYILKSKTYTPFNAPTGFYSYYGRYINPQEAISFVILNKAYSDISPSKYNGFSWASLKKEQVLNEKYIFDEASMNSEITLPTSVYENYYTLSDTTDATFYRNAGVVTMPDDFVEELKNELNGESDENIKLILSTSSQTEAYFKNIKFDLLKDSLTGVYLTPSSPKASVDVSAKFTSSNTFDVDTPIDILSYPYITLSFDNKEELTINLLEECEDSSSLTAYYVYLDNDITDSTNARIDSTITDESSEEYAGNRSGIVQLINSQIANIGKTNSKYYSYNGAHSYQYLGLNKSSSSETVATISSENEYYATTLNGQKIAFNLGSSIKDSIVSFFSKYSSTKYYNASADLTYTLGSDASSYGQETFPNGFFHMPEESSANGAYAYYHYDSTYGWIYSVPESGTDLTDGTYFTYESKDTDVDSTNTTTWTLSGLVDAFNYFFNNMDSSSSDADGVYIYTDSAWTTYNFSTHGSLINLRSFKANLTNNVFFSTEEGTDDDSAYSDGTYDISIENLNENGLSDSKVLFEVNDTSATINSESTSDLFQYITGNSLTSDYSEILPDVEPAVTYDSVASITSDGRLLIQSPLTGESSTLYFYINGRSTTADFMYTVMGLRYSYDSSHTYKSFGVRTVELVTENYIAAYINSTDEYVATYPGIGDVIITDNDINHSYTFGSLYANYKLSANSYLVIGSVRDNWVSADDEDPPDVKGLEGGVIISGDDGYTYDEKLSDFEVKLTEDEVETNSYYTIDDESFVKQVDHISLPLATISTSSSVSLDIPLKIKIDDMSDYASIDIGDISTKTGSSILTSIKDWFSSSSNSSAINEINATDIADNIDDVFSYDYNNKNEIILSNLLKSDGGTIILGYQSTDNDSNKLSDDSRNAFYNRLLGTNITNPDLYDIWTIDAMEADNDTFTEADNVVYLSTTEYYYVPTLSCPLKFKYRYLKDGVSTRPDYYIDFVGDNTSNYEFRIYKVSDGNFPDGEFYMHFVQDRTYEGKSVNSPTTIVSTDEDSLQSFMNKKKLAGTEITFLKPYFKPFQISAEIVYNDNYSESTVRTAVSEALAEEFSLDNLEISQSISKSKIFKIIMNVTGVESCNITYFGSDITDSSTNQDYKLSASFYEMLCYDEDNSVLEFVTLSESDE